ncbi:hypothetical protein CTAYLR_003592 [Chrysophaeum taylorii]|uniref:EF-hand domain-containing protein n=1 Tax=Chrysophaeum taylorii TaxID=2483200 RepID=A0AAD7XP66_9STRA|nr:hypothetical protein CTAYLR_003592 [Chrysophaeum taylorii]
MERLVSALRRFGRVERLAALGEDEEAGLRETALAAIGAMSVDVVKGLEALRLVTSSPRGAAIATEVGAARAVQRSLATHPDDPRIKRLASAVAASLVSGGGSPVGSERTKASFRSTRLPPVSPRRLPYDDVDFELFESAYLLGPRETRRPAVRLLERLFAPPAGAVSLEESRYLAALDLRRSERDALAAARKPDEGCFCFGEGLARSLARRALVEAAKRGEPPTLSVEGCLSSRPLKAADPTALERLFRLLDDRKTGHVEAKYFEAAVRCASGDALSDEEIGALASHYASKKTDEHEESVVVVVDYELFVSSAKIGAAFGGCCSRKTKVPVKPWIDQQRRRQETAAEGKPDVERRSRGLTWDAHVRRIKEARGGAFAYLVRRGFSAIRHARRRAGAFRRLSETGARSTSLVALRAAARAARDHAEAQRRAAAWLRDRVARARKHRLKQDETARYLRGGAARKARGERDARAGRSTKVNRAYARHAVATAAFDYLRARGASAKARSPLLRAAQRDLARLGVEAVAATTRRDVALARLRHRSRRTLAVVVGARAVAGRDLARLGQRVRAQTKARGVALAGLVSTARSAARHAELRSDAFGRLCASGRSAVARLYRRVSACDALRARGAAARAHRASFAVARDALRRRVARLGELGRVRARIRRQLGELGGRALRTAAAQRAARTWLRREVDSLRASKFPTTKNQTARLELSSLVRKAKNDEIAKRLALEYPKRYEHHLKAVRSEVPPSEDGPFVERLFGTFDFDGSGGIDRVEFGEMMRTGALLGIKPPRRSQLDDAFAQLDADRSGTVSFAELYAWLARARRATKRRPTFGAVVPPKRQALLRLLAEHARGDLDLENSPPPIVDEKTTKKSPRRRTLRRSRSEGRRPRLEKEGEPKMLDARGFLERCSSRPVDAEDEAYASDFLALAKAAFEMMDADARGTLSLEDVRRGVAREDVRNFLFNSNSKDLQYLLVPQRIDSAVSALAKKKNSLGIFDWTRAIEEALVALLAERKKNRDADAAFASEVEADAKRVFELMDGGLDLEQTLLALEKTPIVVELERVLFELDAPRECAVAAAVRAGLATLESDRHADREFAGKFRLLAREVFHAIDADDDDLLERAQVDAARAKFEKVRAFLRDSGGEFGELETTNGSVMSAADWERAVERAISNKLEARRLVRRRDADAAGRRRRTASAASQQQQQQQQLAIAADASSSSYSEEEEEKGGGASEDDGAGVSGSRRRSPAGLPVSSRKSRMCIVS